MIKGYDQYKTASPHDDETDWGELGVTCPECECDCLEQQDSDGYYVYFWCPDCGLVSRKDLDEVLKLFPDERLDTADL